MAPTIFYQTASSSLSLPPHSYVYSLIPSSAALALIASDDSLRLFDRETLHLLPNGLVETHHQGVTCLARTNDSSAEQLVTGGRDGLVRTWDPRNGKEVSRFNHGSSAAVTSLASRQNQIAAGTELVFSQASITAWDVRFPSKVMFQYVESHSDDITDLHFHPTRDSLLLSGSTDGLVNIYDTLVQGEEDALFQVINHGSVHRAGFLSDDVIYALSHDEQFAIYPLNSPKEDVAEVEPVLFGDLRQVLDCEYAIQILNGTQGPALAVGNHSAPWVDLVPLKSSPSTFDRSETIRLSGGHGEEIVRGVFVDGDTRSVFTCGEDGLVRVWEEVDGLSNQGRDEDVVMSKEPVSPRPKDGRKVHSSRYKPY